MVVSFGTMFNDLNMGRFWSHDPSPEERTRYDVLFCDSAAAGGGRPVEGPARAGRRPSQSKLRPLSLVKPAAKAPAVAKARRAGVAGPQRRRAVESARAGRYGAEVAPVK